LLPAAPLPRSTPACGGGKNSLKAYPIGFFHIDIAEVQTTEGKLYLFVAVARTSKLAFVRPVE
jgi:hypothetical protein